MPPVATPASAGVTTIASLPVLAVDVGGTKLEAGLVDADGCILGRRRAATTGDDGDALDRKSTRLNSSHALISYAVFCLKKKNKHKKTKKNNKK